MPTYDDLSRKLDSIEAELRTLGYLTGEVGEPARVTSAFGIGEMPFQHWLARVFLPAARRAVAEKDLPKGSSVGTAAIRNLDGCEEAETLVSLLCEFDYEMERVEDG
jgi:uncharacterized protein YqcC (DUF446 family)